MPVSLNRDLGKDGNSNVRGLKISDVNVETATSLGLTRLWCLVKSFLESRFDIRDNLHEISCFRGKMETVLRGISNPVFWEEK